MKFIVLAIVCVVYVTCRPEHKGVIDLAELERQQIENAKYQFSSNIEDHINDLSQKRVEVRDGPRVQGAYSYTDGFINTTIHYVADENGYRVTKMELHPLPGPKINLEGTATVNSEAHGARIAYRIASVPVEGPISKIVN